VLEVSGLTKRFGGFTAVSGVSFSVAEGEILGLIGPNGSGKSTTFNLIAGLHAPSAGSVRLKGEEIGGLLPASICHRGIARTFQIPRPFRKLSLLENVAIAAFYGQDRKVSREQAYAAAADALGLVQLPAGPEARVDGLGAAGLKKLELARALATGPKLLLLDEPTEGIQPNVVQQIGDVVEKLRGERNMTVLLVEQKLPFARRLAQHFCILERGRVAASGKMSELTNELVDRYLKV